MAINRDIVATRKLARLGRGGDTKIREVDSKKSHVNALEAYLIDANGKAGEEYTKKVGAGTINPFTGMPEYHEVDDHSTANHQTHVQTTETDDDGTQYIKVNYDQPLYTMGDIKGSEYLQTNIWQQTNPYKGQQDFSDLSKMTDMEKTQYLTEFGLDADDLQYITPFEDKPFEFMKAEQGLALSGIGLEGRELGASLRQQTGDLQTAFADTSRTLGTNLRRGKQAAATTRDISTQRSNLARAGTITEGFEQQIGELTQDYTAGIGRGEQALASGLRLADISYDFGREKLDLSKQEVMSDYDKSKYTEEQRQKEQFYKDIMQVKQFK